MKMGIYFMPGIVWAPVSVILILYLVYTTFTTVISRQNILIWLPKKRLIKGISPLHEMSESYVERSSAQRNACWRSSIAEGKKKKRANSTGICISMGRQPLIGLTPALL